jgi:hypothetical protein
LRNAGREPCTLNIESGDSALEHLTQATHLLPAVNNSIHYGGLYQAFDSEQNSAPDPSCPTDNNEGRNLSSTAFDASSSTIYWLFKDGDA